MEEGVARMIQERIFTIDKRMLIEAMTDYALRKYGIELKNASVMTMPDGTQPCAIIYYQIEAFRD